MKLSENLFLKALREGKPQIGLWLSLASAYATEAVASVGYDWMLIDMEHSPNSIETVMAQLQVLAAHDTTAIVRPDWNDPVKVKRLLDIGAPGLLFPMVQSQEEAERAVAAAHYPPRGIRGVAGTTRANAFGRITDYYERIGDETAILVQAETIHALNIIEDFADVEGVDGVFFGPADISADMGLLGQALHKDVWAKIMPAAEKLMKRGIPVGTLVMDPQFAKQLLSDGFSFVACGADAGLLARGSDALLKSVKSD